jgi:hypothetical protein
MARETKAQREAREAAERQEAWDKFREEYPQRFAKVLFDFARLHAFGVRGNDEFFRADAVDAETYYFAHDWASATLKVTVPLNQDWGVLYSLERVEEALRGYYADQAEQQRKESVRRTALTKLNSEERELLGL